MKFQKEVPSANLSDNLIQAAGSALRPVRNRSAIPRTTDGQTGHWKDDQKCPRFDAPQGLLVHITITADKMDEQDIVKGEFCKDRKIDLANEDKNNPFAHDDDGTEEQAQDVNKLKGQPRHFGMTTKKLDGPLHDGGKCSPKDRLRPTHCALPRQLLAKALISIGSREVYTPFDPGGTVNTIRSEMVLAASTVMACVTGVLDVRLAACPERHES